MNDILYQDLCLGCGEIKPKGIIPIISHVCPKNIVYYRGGSVFTLRKVINIFKGTDEMQSFKDLITEEQLPHFKAAIPFGQHPTEESNYFHARQWEIKFMKRIRSWINIEEEFDAKY